jgi:hypothetical protein
MIDNLWCVGFSEIRNLCLWCLCVIHSHVFLSRSFVPCFAKCLHSHVLSWSIGSLICKYFTCMPISSWSFGCLVCKYFTCMPISSWSFGSLVCKMFYMHNLKIGPNLCLALQLLTCMPILSWSFVPCFTSVVFIIGDVLKNNFILKISCWKLESSRTS